MMLALFIDVAILVFVAGNVYRVVRILRLPAHLRWELYPMPRGTPAQRRRGRSYFEESEWWVKPAKRAWGSEIAYIAREVLAFATLRQRNRPLWLWSWLLHVGMYALVAGMGAGLLGLVWPGTFLAMIPWMIGVAACAGIPGAVGLLANRFGRLRAFSSRADVFNLLLIASLFTSGAAALLSDAQVPRKMIALAGALLFGNPVPELGVAAMAHVALLGAFLAYFPATHMTHAYMKFFAFHTVRWDDAPLAHHPTLERALRRNLDRSVSWAAPHIGGKNWAAAVARGPEEERR